jgi:hypothetical protein
MERRTANLYVGLFVILFGILLLLQNMGLFGAFNAIIWMALFAFGGFGMLGVAVQNAERWWALIPGMVLLSLATLIGMNAFAPGIDNRWGGSIFLGGIGLAFWVISLRNRSTWWAIIPAGVLTTLAVVAGAAPSLPDTFAGSILFIGLACTFGLVFLNQRSHGHAMWALIVAGVMGTLAVVTLSNSFLVVEFVWPVALILGGLVLLIRAMRQGQPQKVEEHYDNPTLPQSH